MDIEKLTQVFNRIAFEGNPTQQRVIPENKIS